MRHSKTLIAALDSRLRGNERAKRWYSVNYLKPGLVPGFGVFSLRVDDRELSDRTQRLMP